MSLAKQVAGYWWRYERSLNQALEYEHRRLRWHYRYQKSSFWHFLELGVPGNYFLAWIPKSHFTNLEVPDKGKGYCVYLLFLLPNFPSALIEFFCNRLQNWPAMMSAFCIWLCRLAKQRWWAPVQMKPFVYGTVFRLTRTKRKESLAAEMSLGLHLTPCPIFDDFIKRRFYYAHSSSAC